MDTGLTNAKMKLGYIKKYLEDSTKNQPDQLNRAKDLKRIKRYPKELLVKICQQIKCFFLQSQKQFGKCLEI